jgi:hypothetical protein
LQVRLESDSRALKRGRGLRAPVGSSGLGVVDFQWLNAPDSAGSVQIQLRWLRFSDPNVAPPPIGGGHSEKVVHPDSRDGLVGNCANINRLRAGGQGLSCPLN